MPSPAYVIYARKSSESEDRQVLSVDAQVAELKSLAQRRGLSVSRVLTEARSAKEPGRPIFTELVKAVSRGQVKGILCWKLDRLARNPVDGGSMIWALKQHGLRIETPTQTYSAAEDNTILMYIEFGMAQKYIDDLSQNVKRGNRAKLESGGYPGLAPQGYLNDVVNHTIGPDPDRFTLVRQMWDLMLTGTYSVPRIVRTANERWAYRTRIFRRLGGRKLHASGLYKVFGNPFYYGLIKRRVEGEVRTFVGSHKPMVTEDEFGRVQQILGREHRHKPQRYALSYTGLMTCAECHGAITGEVHVKPSGKRYVYYHCTKKRETCSQPYLPEQELEEQFTSLLNRITISDRFRDWAVARLKEAHRQEAEARGSMFRSQQNAYAGILDQLDRLLDMKLRGQVAEEEYERKRVQLRAEQASLKLKLADTEHRAADWLELAEQALNFANLAPKLFQKATHEQKREIVAALGLNYILNNRVLTLDLQKPFELLQIANAQTEKPRLTPRSFALGRPRGAAFERLLERIVAHFKVAANRCVCIPDLRQTHP